MSPCAFICASATGIEELDAGSAGGLPEGRESVPPPVPDLSAPWKDDEDDNNDEEEEDERVNADKVAPGGGDTFSPRVPPPSPSPAHTRGT
jgi:hypothetical protein